MLCITGCASATGTGGTGQTPQRTATAQPACLALIPGATLATGVPGVPGIQLPKDTYIGSASSSGGGDGQYAVQSYALCFLGAESAIDGGLSGPSGQPSSTLAALVRAGWTLNNLFPDASSFAYLDACADGHTCVNTTDASHPFTFLGVDQFASQSGGYTTFRMQVATIAAPTCLNDPNYYSGAPQYVLFQDDNSFSDPAKTYHFQMPPGTRKSSFLGGGTAGSVYVYYCSAGTQATVNSMLAYALAHDGYQVSGIANGCFEANKGTNPMYGIQVCVTNPNNYYLRIFVPI